MAQVLLKSINKIYENGFQAVKDASLYITDKEFMVIVGPSGCGKTTTLRMIAGLEEITEGTILIGDRIVNDVPPKDRDIAMVFQNYALYPHMTVYQNMAFGLKLRKYPKSEIKQKVEKAARMLDIENYLNKKPKVLSGGQRQRVALGRAIVREPKAFLFDEPLSNLDAKLRVTTRTELKALHHRLQTTSIYVTHDQSEAMTLGDRICVMYNGVIQQVASPMELYDRPVNRFVAGFLGTPSMNFLDGRIQTKQGNPIFLLGEGAAIDLRKLDTDLSPYVDRNMVLGIRPEHLIVNSKMTRSGNNNGLPFVVQVVEPLGDRKEVYLASKGGDKFIANLDPHIEMRIDDEIMVHIDIDKIHIFEPGETGENVTLEL